MSDKDKAADCPWCGPMRGHYGYTVGRFGTRLTCFCCDSHGPIAPTQDAALEAWNRRAIPAIDPAAIREATLEACTIIDAAAKEGHKNPLDLFLHLLSAVEPARRALALIGEKK